MLVVPVTKQKYCTAVSNSIRIICEDIIVRRRPPERIPLDTLSGSSERGMDEPTLSNKKYSTGCVRE